MQMNEQMERDMRVRGTRPGVTPDTQVVQKVKVVERTPRFVFVFLATLLVLFFVASFFAWKFYSDAKQVSPPIRADGKATIIANIGNHVLLPMGEEPVFATVTDPAKLADQPFFANAQTGDKVLVFTNAKRAILYRPSTDRIVEMMPIDLGATAF